MTVHDAARDVIHRVELAFDPTCSVARDGWGNECPAWSDDAVVWSFTGAVAAAVKTVGNRSVLQLIGLLTAKFGPTARQVTDKDEALRRLRACLPE